MIRNKLGQFVKGYHPSTEFKKGCIPKHKGTKGYYHSGSFKKGHIGYNKGGYFSEEVRKRMSDGRKGIPSPFKGKKRNFIPKNEFKKGHISHNKGKTKYNYEPLKRQSENQKGRKASVENIINLRKAAKKRWQSEEYIKKLRKSMNRKPNIGEKILINLIKQNNLPYKYTGNFDFFIGRKNPDFVNVNGQKKVIELFGEWWHLKKPDIPYNRTEFGTKAIYSQYGFKTLVIWENELKDMDKVLERIKGFDDVK